MFLRKGVLKIYSKFTGQHPCRSEISIKLLFTLQHGCSPVNFLLIFRTSFLKNTSGWRFLTVSLKEELNDMFRMLVEIYEEWEEIDEKYDDEISFDDMDQKIFSFKQKVHNWVKDGEKLRTSDQVSRCSSKSSSKHSSKSSAKSSTSSKSRSSTKAKGIEENLNNLSWKLPLSRKGEMQSITLGLLWWKKNYPKLKQEQKFMKTEVRLVKAEK